MWHFETTNFEFWVEIFCVPTCFHFPYEDFKTVFVCPSVPREKRSPWLRQYQFYISNWYINGKVFTSTTPWEPKNLIFFKKFEIRIFYFFYFFKFEIEFWLVFDLCQRAEITRVGLNMHLYVDIGDASSSLRGSTSSYLKWIFFYFSRAMDITWDCFY